MTKVLYFQWHLWCFDLLLLLSCQKPATEAIGFSIKGQISYEEAAKIYPALAEEEIKEPFLVVEFFNWGNHNYFVNTVDSMVCFVGGETFFDQNEKVIGWSIIDFFGVSDLCKIAPNSKKRFLTHYIEPDTKAHSVEISFLLYGDKQDSTFRIKKTFDIEDGKIIY